MFKCSHCGRETEERASSCRACHHWGTIEDEDAPDLDEDGPQLLESIKLVREKRLRTCINELDLLLGPEEEPGIVPGTLLLLSGDPGAGKSTLALQIAESFDSPLYVTSEETSKTVKRQTKRLKVNAPNMQVWPTSDIDKVLAHDLDIDFAIFDSLHTMMTSAVNGAPGQVNQTCSIIRDIMMWTRELDIVSLVIAHINGDHEVSGAKTLEHMVDAPMHLSIVTDTERMMTVKKNRHGPAPVKGILQMGPHGFVKTSPLKAVKGGRS